MPKFTVDGIVFHSEDLSDEGKAVIDSLQFLEHQMRTLRQQIEVYEAAKAALVDNLRTRLAPLDDDEA